MAVRDNFAAHDPSSIASPRERDPAAYLSMVNSMVPREALLIAEEKLDVVDYDSLNDAEFVDAMDGEGGDFAAALAKRNMRLS